MPGFTNRRQKLLRAKKTRSASDTYILSLMRVDPKGTIAGKPDLLVRDCLRTLRVRGSWDLPTLEAASLEPGTGSGLES